MATTVHNDARPCCLCGGPVVQWPEPTMEEEEEEEEEEEDADDMTHPSLPPEQQWLCHAAVLKHNGERSPWRHQHPRRDVRAAAAERAAAAAGLAAEAARPDGSEQQEGRPVAGAGGDVSACGEEASGSNGGGQASDGGSWDFESDDGSGAGREGWGDPEGDASEDEEGDWAQPAILLEEGYSNKRLVLTPPSHLYHNRVSAAAQEGEEAPVAGWGAGCHRAPAPHAPGAAHARPSPAPLPSPAHVPFPCHSTCAPIFPAGPSLPLRIASRRYKCRGATQIQVGTGWLPGRLQALRTSGTASSAAAGPCCCTPAAEVSRTVAHNPLATCWQ